MKPPVRVDPNPHALYWTERQHNDPGHAWLRRTIREAMNERDPAGEVEYW